MIDWAIFVRLLDRSVLAAETPLKGESLTIIPCPGRYWAYLKKLSMRTIEVANLVHDDVVGLAMRGTVESPRLLNLRYDVRAHFFMS